MALIATAGSASANSYVTVAGAYALLLPTLRATVLNDGELIIGLEDALIWATRLIDEQVAWYGTPATTTQALAWPQLGAVTPLGQALSGTTIPAFLQQATAEYALALLQEYARQATTAATDAVTSLRGLKSLTIQDVRMEVQDDLQAMLSQIATAVHMPATVRRTLAPYGDVAGSMTVPLRRT